MAICWAHFTPVTISQILSLQFCSVIKFCAEFYFLAAILWGIWSKYTSIANNCSSRKLQSTLSNNILNQFLLHFNLFKSFSKLSLLLYIYLIPNKLNFIHELIKSNAILVSCEHDIVAEIDQIILRFTSSNKNYFLMRFLVHSVKGFGWIAELSKWMASDEN